MNVEKDIFIKYANGTASDEEKALVEAWIADFDYGDHELHEVKFFNHIKSLDKKIKEKSSIRKIGWLWSSVAAAAIVLTLFSLLLLFQNKISDIDAIVDINNIKAPISSNTILTLENDEEYNLDSLHSGDTLKTQDYLLTRLASGELKYIKLKADDSPIYNKLKTISGGIAQVRLSDGTLIWLNANSELTYPISFDGGQREILLVGEGYFEVASSELNKKKHPFYVRGEGHTVQVLGTKFNVNFHKNNEVALLEGRVKIAQQGSSLESNNPINFDYDLSPNQVYANGSIATAKHIRKYIDWKEGYFDLTDAKLSELLVELSDWYGVQIEAKSSLDKHHLFGSISRNKDLKEVLDIICEATPITYTTNNNSIIITNK